MNTLPNTICIIFNLLKWSLHDVHSKYIFVPPVAVCLGAFDDFRVICDKTVGHNVQYIIPELNFSCDGTVTQWKVGLEDRGNGRSVNLQIWRSVGAGEYTSMTEVVYTKTVREERIATVPVSMSVMAGDMIGFYVPSVPVQLHTLPDVGLTMYTTGGSPTSSLSSLGSVVGPSPYISVMFGENYYCISNFVTSCVLTCAARVYRLYLKVCSTTSVVGPSPYISVVFGEWLIYRHSSVLL